MTHSPTIPGPPPNPLANEWIELLADISDLDKRRLARWLAANGIELPENWERVSD